MSEGYIEPEEIIPDEEIHKEILEQLFCGTLSQEDAARLYDRGVKHIESGLAGISGMHLLKFSEKYDQEDMPTIEDAEDDVFVSENQELYNTYRLFRAEGFAHEEVAGLCEAISKGELEAVLSGEITRERTLANEFIVQSEEKIAHADEELSHFAEQVRGQNPAYQKPQALFTGKYQNLVIFSGNSSEVTPSTSSLYSSGENVVLVHIKNLASHAEFDEAKVSSILHTYVHENVHSTGANTIEKGAKYLPLDPTSAEALHSGFFHTTEDDKKFRLYNMSEATTEYFARKISGKAGLRGHQELYKPHVECLEKLFAYLEEGNIVGTEERERVLREQYGSTDGVESLHAQLEREMGPFALEVCDTLFDISDEFEQFLSSVRRMKNGEQVNGELWVAAQRFKSQFPQLPLSEIHQAYPFLHFGARVYDEETQQLKWLGMEEMNKSYRE